MTHNLNILKDYPQHHLFISTPNVLNLHSNVKVSVGDTIVLEKVRYVVEKIKNLQSELTFGKSEYSEETEKGNRSKFNKDGEELIHEELEELAYSTPQTVFYNLKLKRNEEENI